MEKRPLKERIAALKVKRQAISKEAQVRVAAAYTVSKSLAPTAPAEVHKKLAMALLMVGDTKILTAALRQTAVNNYYTKVAETLRDIHKIEMNDLLEKPEVLSKLRSEIESELKGGVKSATGKKADDRSDCGIQPETYKDPSIGIEPSELDASHAADRKEDTVNKSLGDKKEAKKATEEEGSYSAFTPKDDSKEERARVEKNLKREQKQNAPKKAHAGCVGADCKECKAAAEAQAKVGKGKKADEAAPADAPAGDVPAPAPEGSEELPGDASIDDAPEDEPLGDAPVEAEGEIVIDNEKKEQIIEQIDAARSSIDNLQQEIEEAEKDDGEALLGLTEGEDEVEEVEPSEEELDLENIFDEGTLNEHKGSLSHEAAEDGSDEISFAPASAAEMEAAMEGGDKIADAAEFFASAENAGEAVDAMFAYGKEAAAEPEGVVKPGDLVDEFQATELGGSEVDNDSDHDEDIFGDVLKSLKDEGYSVGKPRETEPDMKAPEPIKGGKVGAKPKAGSSKENKPIRKLKVSAPTVKEAKTFSSLLFLDEEDYR